MNRICTARPIISPQEHLARQLTIKYWSMVLALCIHTAARFIVQYGVTTLFQQTEPLYKSTRFRTIHKSSYLFLFHRVAWNYYPRAPSQYHYAREISVLGE